MKYNEIIKNNNRLKKTNRNSPYVIGILSNTVVNQLSPILEYRLQKENINAQVKLENHNDILQEISRKIDVELLIVFWELAHFIDHLCYRIEPMSKKEIADIFQQAKKAIKLLFQHIENIPLVLFNQFSAAAFSQSGYSETPLDFLANELNQFIALHLPKNVKLVRLDAIFLNVSLAKAIDWRFFISSRSLYTINFFNTYTDYIVPLVLAQQGKIKKAVIFDCDHTLWRGILGEDGFDGIKMSFHEKEGVPFAAVQAMAVNLAKQGVLIGLCSKNNLEEVNNVLKNHPDCLLKDSYIVIKKVNWQDKITNLKEIAEQLNIGVDSLVYVDDSDFEINLIREKLPEVLTIQVPKNISSYPSTLKGYFDRLFLFAQKTDEDANKTQFYKIENLRKIEKEEYSSIDDYLASLSLTMKIFINHKPHIKRIAQLTQKTNQFNLTTKRYNESEISNFIFSVNHHVFTFDLSDRFGNYGTTGLIIIEYSEKDAVIDTFLMSCRVIGRNVEFPFLQYVVYYLSQIKICCLKAYFERTSKNDQVSNFYEKINMFLQFSTNEKKYYTSKVDQLKFPNIQYIKVKDEFEVKGNCW